MTILPLQLAQVVLFELVAKSAERVTLSQELGLYRGKFIGSIGEIVIAGLRYLPGLIWQSSAA